MLHNERTDMSSLAHPRHRQMAQGYVWLNQRPTSLREQVQRTIVPQVVVPIKLIVKAFGDPLLAYSYFSCDITCAFPRLSLHSCNYGISVARCPYSPWATCTSRLTEALIHRWKHLAPAKSWPVLCSKSLGASVMNGLCHRELRAYWQHLSRVCPKIIGSQYRSKNLVSRMVSHILATITRSPL